ncbi:hypothetical protein LBYZC6_39590 [Lacrimispora brassicae]
MVMVIVVIMFMAMAVFVFVTMLVAMTKVMFMIMVIFAAIPMIPLMVMPFVFQKNVKIIGIQAAFPCSAKVKMIAVHPQALQGLCKNFPIRSQV